MDTMLQLLPYMSDSTKAVYRFKSREFFNDYHWHTMHYVLTFDIDTETWSVREF